MLRLSKYHFQGLTSSEIKNGRIIACKLRFESNEMMLNIWFSLIRIYY